MLAFVEIVGRVPGEFLQERTDVMIETEKRFVLPVPVDELERLNEIFVCCGTAGVDPSAEGGADGVSVTMRTFRTCPVSGAREAMIC